MKRFFRVNHEGTQQGLWYNFRGEFTGLIHDRFSFCQNRELRMEFDPELIGLLSAVETMDELFEWFSREDILRLQDEGFFVHEYETDDFKWYVRFNHYVIRQSNAKLIGKHPLS
ncbi:MAG TPA: hypothetical protein VF719_07230 [Abditibacteriaceae bacterium]|jgi:hypothetical protein